MSIKKIVLITSFIWLSGCVSTEQETDIPIDQVPAVVMQAAMQALPGFAIESAEIETEDGIDTYELEGTSEGRKFEIEISPTGEVLEIEEVE